MKIAGAFTDHFKVVMLVKIPRHFQSEIKTQSAHKDVSSSGCVDR